MAASLSDQSVRRTKPGQSSTGWGGYFWKTGQKMKTAPRSLVT
jgi:hypothetical protein